MKRTVLIASVLCMSAAVFGQSPNVVLQVTPASGSPVDCYGKPVGAKGELVFELPVGVKEVMKAQLAMMVDDIDSRQEASITLNGNAPLHIPDDAVAEGQFHPAFMDVPLDQLREGRNVFTFTFMSNLGNSTKGFVIDEAYLMLTVAQEATGKAASKPSVRVRTTSSVADMVEHRGEEPLFTITGSREREGAFEVPSPFVFPKIVSAKNGDILMMAGADLRRSSDGGRTWASVVKMSIGVSCVIRLQSGLLGARSNMDFYVSADEGKTWEKQGSIAAAAERRWTGEGAAHFDVLMQTKSGRIFLPTRGSAAANVWLAQRSAARGLRGGEIASIEGHAHRPEADYTIVYYSDDEGRSWQRSDGALMVWKDDGYGGMWPCDEPNIIELLNGDVMLYFRTTLGRIYTARSGPVEFMQTGGPQKGQTVKGSPGEYFEYPRETALAGAYTPCRVRRIPSTGDLLLVWNQVSGDEMRGGYSRGRLSSAISRDDGKTWEHFRTLDRTVLPPAGRVAPDPESAMARAFDYVGELPDDHGMVDYPNMEFHGDTVLVTWIRAIIKPRPGQFTGGRLLVAPVSWFYEDEPAYEPPTPTATLEVNGVEVPSVYIDDRFLVDLTDVAKALGRTVAANMFAPVHQTLTYLGEKPVYDESGMGDKEKPMLRVTVVESEKGALVIRIDENERIFMNERQTALESLRSRLGQEISRTGQTRVTIRCDKSVPLGFLTRISDIAKRAGAQQLNLAHAGE